MGQAGAQTVTKWVYAFGGGSADGDAGMRDLLGGKGANLAEMSALGLPVPPGFTLSTEVCTAYYDNDRAYPDGLDQQVADALKELEAKSDKKFGDPANPLLVSVRSGARASMPGMMDTVLNLGLNDETAEGLANLSGDRRFALDSYRRFIQMFSDVVLGVKHEHLEALMEDYKEENDLVADTDLSADDWAEIINLYKAEVRKRLGRDFPTDPNEQLWAAISAVFKSWMNDRAITYRNLHDIPAEWGTAVNVQAMVFGNMGEDSATGVAFTRNPSTGERKLYGEFLINAQGEDVVAGIRTPQSLTKEAREERKDNSPSLEEAMPETYKELLAVFDQLERHYRDMQDIEFTVEKSRLWMLQTRNGKRTAKAAFKIAVDMAREELISQDEAVLRVDPGQLDQLLHPTLDPDGPRDLLSKGLPASPGAAVGEVVFSSEDAQKISREGRPVILVRPVTTPEDIHGMHVSQAIVTSQGGMTSHAAVVARGMGTPCVCGAGDIRIDVKAGVFKAAGREVKAGEIITVDGATGEVFLGEVAMIEPELTGDFAILMAWADEARRLGVRANAETPSDVRTAKSFGAEGIGLCRTEHMFFDAERISKMREMILSKDEAGRRAALDKLLPFQRADFEEIFTIMEDRPCTIRLLDPPLHEFLPHTEEDVAEVAEATGLPRDALMQRASELHEENPMLGHRGCRLAITYPEIYEMQARAIFEAQAAVQKATGVMPLVEIMIPLVGFASELALLRSKIDAVAAALSKETGFSPEYLVGTMIELPRAAVRADEIATHADFFSFGTNDLTQTTLGLSRDDSARFMSAYVDGGLIERDPFQTLDKSGVGDLIRLAAARGRTVKSGLKLGICGEHGGDPSSVDFCDEVGLDYVSCSPYRLPIARLSAAQASLRARK